MQNTKRCNLYTNLEIVYFLALIIWLVIANHLITDHILAHYQRGENNDFLHHYGIDVSTICHVEVLKTEHITCSDSNFGYSPHLVLLNSLHESHEPVYRIEAQKWKGAFMCLRYRSEKRIFATISLHCPPNHFRCNQYCYPYKKMLGVVFYCPLLDFRIKSISYSAFTDSNQQFKYGSKYYEIYFSRAQPQWFPGEDENLNQDATESINASLFDKYAYNYDSQNRRGNQNKRNIHISSQNSNHPSSPIRHNRDNNIHTIETVTPIYLDNIDVRDTGHIHIMNDRNDDVKVGDIDDDVDDDSDGNDDNDNDDDDDTFHKYPPPIMRLGVNSQPLQHSSGEVYQTGVCLDASSQGIRQQPIQLVLNITRVCKSIDTQFTKVDTLTFDDLPPYAHFFTTQNLGENMMMLDMHHNRNQSHNYGQSQNQSQSQSTATSILRAEAPSWYHPEGIFVYENTSMSEFLMFIKHVNSKAIPSLYYVTEYPTRFSSCVTANVKELRDLRQLFFNSNDTGYKHTDVLFPLLCTYFILGFFVFLFSIRFCLERYYQRQQLHSTPYLDSNYTHYLLPHQQQQKQHQYSNSRNFNNSGDSTNSNNMTTTLHGQQQYQNQHQQSPTSPAYSISYLKFPPKSPLKSSRKKLHKSPPYSLHPNSSPSSTMNSNDSFNSTKIQISDMTSDFHFNHTIDESHISLKDMDQSSCRFCCSSLSVPLFFRWISVSQVFVVLALFSTVAAYTYVHPTKVAADIFQRSGCVTGEFQDAFLVQRFYQRYKEYVYTIYFIIAVQCFIAIFGLCLYLSPCTIHRYDVCSICIYCCKRNKCLMGDSKDGVNRKNDCDNSHWEDVRSQLLSHVQTQAQAQSNRAVGQSIDDGYDDEDDDNDNDDEDVELDEDDEDEDNEDSTEYTESGEDGFDYRSSSDAGIQHQHQHQRQHQYYAN